MNTGAGQSKPVWGALLCAAMLSLAAWAAWRNLRLARAEEAFGEATLEGIREAARIEPFNGRYHLALAELLDRDGQSPSASLRDAARLMPAEAAVWIRLGLDAESAGRFEEAERLLLRAAALSRKFEARWVLANYYFRRESGEFWKWARLALEMSYGDRNAVFELCRLREARPEAILDRAIPPRKDVQADFARFLLLHQEWTAAADLLARIAASAGHTDKAALLAACDTMIAGGEWDAAAAVWDAMSGSRLIPYSDLRKGGSPALVNGDFARPSINHGFDWRIAPQAGVWITQRPPPAGWEIQLDGTQPEHAWLLWQAAPVSAPGTYLAALDYSCSTDSVEEAGAGLYWQVFSAALDGGPPDGGMMVEVPLDCGKSRVEAAFPARAGLRGVRLVLAHRRVKGFARWEGKLVLRRAGLGREAMDRLP